ncbi:hypothetical protein MTO96_019189 [Rhipicephalus appendiculatus]
MLVASSAIGIFYAFKAAKKPQAPKSMGAIPVAMSLISTSISPVAMLGIPAEMYFYGLGFIMIQLGLLFTVLLTNHIYMPMFYNLDVTSAFQIVYMSIVLYGPALALQQVTGVNLWLSVVSIGVVCTFYTTVGGIKAIVMADVFMSFIKYASIILLAVKGTIDVGGWHSVYEKNLSTKRLSLFDFRPDPTVRHSVWSLVIGGTFLWLTMYAVNQGWVQRYLSMPSVATVRRAMWMNLLGVIALQSALCYVGLVIFTRYNDCDPVSTRQVAAADQSALSILGIVGGPLVGVYSLGIFVPFANSIGAVTSLVAGVATLSWISVGAYLRRPFHWRPPVSVDGCVQLYLNATGLEQPTLPSVDIDAHK